MAITADGTQPTSTFGSGTGAIDIVMNLFTSEVVQRFRADWSKDFLWKKIGRSESAAEGGSLEDFVDMVESSGLSGALLPAVVCGAEGPKINWRLPYSYVADVVAKYPQLFRGLAGIDPTEGMRGIRALESAVKNDGFVGAHLYPHWFGLPPDDRRYYPFYAKCIELDIPIQMQVGHCLAYAADAPLKSVGRPITLDTIACDFPELKLIGIHTGWPWTEEMVAVSYKHANVYIGIDAYRPRHLDPKLVHFMNTFGKGKVMFGTDFPVIHPQVAMQDIEELGLRPDALSELMRGVAMRLYKFE